MSLAIDTDKVTAVLLADGWHEVIPFTDGRSSFALDAYEFVDGDASGTSAYVSFKGGQELPTVPATGFTFYESNPAPTSIDHADQILSGPITSIIAVCTTRTVERTARASSTS